MAGSFTNLGQDYCLYGTSPTVGGLANLATAIRLYTAASTPAKDGTGFTQIASGNGYPAGGYTIVKANWTQVTLSGDRGIRLADQVVTASGGSIPSFGGSYLVDASNNPLAWWPLASPVILAPGEYITLAALTIKLG